MAGSFVCSLALIASAYCLPLADDGPTVTVGGTGRQSFEPDTVRVRWRVHASGKSYKSALKKLDACRAYLKKKLAGLDPPQPTHRFGPAVEHDKPEGGMAGMQARVMQMAMGQGGVDEKTPNRIRLAFPVTLDWTLGADSLPDRQRQVDRIREQLRELDVLDASQADDDDDDEEVDDDKQAGESGSEATEAGRTPTIRIEDGPTFSYLRRLSKDEMDGVAKLAFRRAEDKAARLASAAGRTLGALVRVSDSPAAGAFDSEAQQIKMMSQMFGKTRPSFDDDKDRPETELVSDELGPIWFTVRLSATFRLD